MVTLGWHLDYDLVIDEGAMRVTPVNADASVLGSRRVASLQEYLSKNGLHIYFEDDATVTPDGILLKVDRSLPPYDPSDLRDLDWTGIDLSRESQGDERRSDTVQAHMIEHVKTLADWDVILDDDIQNEMADIVALRIQGTDLIVHLTHCKYVSDWEPGKKRSRIEDLYDVCGQAMKSVRWRSHINSFFANLIRRQRLYVARNSASGFMVGNERIPIDLHDQSRLLRPQFTIAIAQPGLQKHHHSAPQLELLAATNTYVYEVANSGFEVYCSY